MLKEWIQFAKYFHGSVYKMSLPLNGSSGLDPYSKFSSFTKITSCSLFVLLNTTHMPY